MTQSFKARKMVPGKDTIRVMATHYNLKPSTVRDIIKVSGAQLIREDGFKGTLVSVRRSSRAAWSDGVVGVDLNTTKLTRPAIMAVARWAFNNTDKNADDN